MPRTNKVFENLEKTLKKTFKNTFKDTKKVKKTIKRKKVGKSNISLKYDNKSSEDKQKGKQPKLVIHQIYGVFRDGKPLSDFPLFMDSKKAWTTLAKKNNYGYKLWNDKMCTDLINKYPEFKSMYNNVKYPVMRADIMRFLILYEYGGMYVDMDVLPLKNSYSFDGLAFCEYYYTPKKPHTNTDMEVIYSPKKNMVLYNFLKYVKEQIKEKNKVKIYDEWKVRYIFQTTGPRSLMRYLRENNIKYDEIKSNLGKENSLNQFKGVDYDVISYFSMSYNPHGKKDVSYKKKK